VTRLIRANGLLPEADAWKSVAAAIADGIKAAREIVQFLLRSSI